jgi:hypothetical protein
MARAVSNLGNVARGVPRQPRSVTISGVDTDVQKSRTVREARRQAMLARAIVEQHTGPMKKIVALTRRYPLPALGIAVGAGLLAGILASSHD